MIMKSSIVKIGGAYFVLIPKALWRKSGLPDKVELLAKPGEIIISAAQKKSKNPK